MNKHLYNFLGGAGVMCIALSAYHYFVTAAPDRAIYLVLLGCTLLAIKRGLL